MRAFGGMTALAVAGLIGAGMAALVLKARRDARRAEFDRVVRSRKLGWDYTGERSGRIDYRFDGRHGAIRWSMWHDSDRNDESPTPKAYWCCENLRTARLSLVIIGRKRYELESGTLGRLLMGVVTGVAQALAGADGEPDKVEFYEAAVKLDEGGPLFRERMVVAQRPEMPRGWVDETVQRALLEWPKSTKRFNPQDAVEVNLGPRGLSLVVQRMPDDMLHWQHLATLGELLADRLAAARG